MQSLLLCEHIMESLNAKPVRSGSSNKEGLRQAGIFGWEVLETGWLAGEKSMEKAPLRVKTLQDLPQGRLFFKASYSCWRGQGGPLCPAVPGQLSLTTKVNCVLSLLWRLYHQLGLIYLPFNKRSQHLNKTCFLEHLRERKSKHVTQEARGKNQRSWSST